MPSMKEVKDEWIATQEVSAQENKKGERAREEATVGAHASVSGAVARCIDSENRVH